MQQTVQSEHREVIAVYFHSNFKLSQGVSHTHIHMLMDSRPINNLCLLCLHEITIYLATETVKGHRVEIHGEVLLYNLSHIFPHTYLGTGVLRSLITEECYHGNQC